MLAFVYSFSLLSLFFIFLSGRFLFALLSTFVFRMYHLRIYHGYVPGINWVQLIRDGIRLLACAVPLRTGTAVYVFLCAFMSSFCRDGLL